MSDVGLANIEALADSSDFVEKKRTRATAWGNCYDGSVPFSVSTAIDFSL